MRTCVVPFCKNNSKNLKEVQFFKITSSRHKAWMLALKRNPEDSVYKDASVCSRHFVMEDFVIIKNKRCLKVGAVPQINLRPLARNLFLYSDKFSVKLAEIPNVPSSNPQTVVKPLINETNSNIEEGSMINHPASLDSEELKVTPKQLGKVVCLDHNYCLSPKKVSLLLEKSNQSVIKLEMELDIERKRVCRFQNILKQFNAHKN